MDEISFKKLLPRDTFYLSVAPNIIRQQQAMVLSFKQKTYSKSKTAPLNLKEWKKKYISPLFYT
jgi:hypothetical protein